MIGYLSLNGSNNMFSQWATADPNIHSYGFGQLYNQNGEPKASQLYPGIWINPVSTSPEEYVVNRSYQILIYDVVYSDDDGTNQNKVVSDCEEYAFRLIRFLRNNSDIFDIKQTPSIQPFSDKFLDDVSGVAIDLVLEFNGESSICNDPDYTFTIKQNDI